MEEDILKILDDNGYDNDYPEAKTGKKTYLKLNKMKKENPIIGIKGFDKDLIIQRMRKYGGLRMERIIAARKEGK